MSWNPSLIDGPIVIPVYGPEETRTDPQFGDYPYRPVVGTVDGYHLNVAPEIMTPELEPYRVNPADPAREIAGGETAFLRFKDEAEAKSVLAGYWIDMPP